MRKIHPGHWLAFGKDKNRNFKPVGFVIPIMPWRRRSAPSPLIDKRLTPTIPWGLGTGLPARRPPRPGVPTASAKIAWNGRDGDLQQDILACLPGVVRVEFIVRESAS